MASFSHFWTVIQRVLGNQKPGLGLGEAMSGHSTSEGYLIALAAGDENAADMPIGSMWRRLNAAQRAVLVAAWTGEENEDAARAAAKRMLTEIVAAL